MGLETLRHALLVCAIVNHAVLMVWFLACVRFHDGPHRLHARWVRLTPGGSTWSPTPAWRCASSACCCSTSCRGWR